MDWQTFGVVAAVGCSMVLVAGLIGSRILRNPVNPVNPVPKNAWMVFLVFAVIATVEAQKPTNNVPQNLNAPMGGGRVFLTGFTGLTGFGNLTGGLGLLNPVNLVNPVQTTPPRDSFAQRKTANWNVRGAWRDWQGLAAKPNGAPQY